MKLFKNHFKKNIVSKGIVTLSFLPTGIAVALSNFKEDNCLKMVHCEFIETQPDQIQQNQLIELVSQFKLFDYDCHLVLTTEHYQRFNIETPSVADNETIEALRWIISDLIDYPTDQAVIDFYPSPTAVRANSKNRLEVIACPVDTINSQIQQCTNAALNLKVIDIQETSLRNLAAQLPENTHGVALLYLLESSGIILIQREKIIYVVRKFDIGYNNLNLQESPLLPAAINALNNLALEVQRSLDYVESYYELSTISALAVIPLAENTHNLLDSLNQNLGITARMIDLSSLIDCDIFITALTQSRCAPVIGALLRYEVEKS